MFGPTIVWDSLRKSFLYFWQLPLDGNINGSGNATQGLFTEYSYLRCKRLFTQLKILICSC